MQLLQGKKALVVGVANKRSIAWGIARSLHAQGAEVILTYQNERLQRNVEQLAQTLDPVPYLLPLDVTEEDALDQLCATLMARQTNLDIIVHSIAHARREDLENEFVETSRNGFLFAMDVSVYSLVALTQALESCINDGASLMTLTYIGATRVMPGYNVMGVAKAALESTTRYLAASLGPRGIRVNAISAGPVKTLAASGVKGISTMLRQYEETAPLRRGVTTEEIGDVASFLASDMSRSITGNVIFADSGFHIMGVS